MADLTDIVTVSVSISGQSPARATFSVPLIASFHTRFPELVRTYRKLADMVADGFVATDAAYQAAASIFAQAVTVPSLKIGRLSTTPTVRVVTMLAAAVNLGVYTVTIDGTTYTFTADASATAAEIATGLVALINADVAAVVTASASVNNLVLTADVAGPDFLVDVGNVALWASIQDSSVVQTACMTTDLAAILAYDANWYALICTRNSHLDQALAAAFVLANKRIFAFDAIGWGSIVAAQNCLAANATNVLGVVKVAANTRSFGIFTKHDADCLAAGLVGLLLPKDVGSWTAHMKTVVGGAVSELTPTEQTNVEANRGNHYQTIAGISVLQKGMMASARFIDEVVISDWVEARIKEEILAAFTFLDKIPYTEAGVAVIEACILRVLEQGVKQGAFVDGSTFARSPRVAGISSTNKQARLLEGVEFGAVLAGAIHKVTMRGNLSP